MIKFEWDVNKNIQNIEKHNIDFAEASTVFLDDEALLMFDDAHSSQEERFIILGMSLKPRLLVVCHCYLKQDNNLEIIRIISARKATKNEAKQYEERNHEKGI